MGAALATPVDCNVEAVRTAAADVAAFVMNARRLEALSEFIDIEKALTWLHKAAATAVVAKRKNFIVSTVS